MSIAMALPSGIAALPVVAGLAGADKPACAAYGSEDPCLPCALTAGGASAPLQTTSRRIKRRETLYRQGDPFRCFYAIRSGTFKSVVSTPSGREQVTGFRMAGEFLGFDALAQDEHVTTAVALEDSEVLTIPYAAGGWVGGSADGVLADLMPRLLSREIVRDHKLMLLLGSGMSADQRLASFLLNLSGRMRARGYCATEFHLRMTRVDIGSYLGLNLETVSRTFTSFQQRGLLEVDGRHVRALDLEALTRFFAGARQAPAATALS